MSRRGHSEDPAASGASYAKYSIFVGFQVGRLPSGTLKCDQ